MMDKLTKCVVVFSLIALVCVFAAPAQSEEPPAMSPEEQQAMEAMAKAAAVGAQHEWLASLAGTWEFSGSFWMAPGAEPMKSTGTGERTVLLGGRVVREDVTGSMFGDTFNGVSHTGYDNVTGKYWSTWFDNMSTSLMVSNGTCVKGDCTFEGTNTDPLTGKAAKARMVSKHEGNQESHKMWGAGPDGKEYLMMEMVYKRKK